MEIEIEIKITLGAFLLEAEVRKFESWNNSYEVSLPTFVWLQMPRGKHIKVPYKSFRAYYMAESGFQNVEHADRMIQYMVRDEVMRKYEETPGAYLCNYPI